MMGSQVLLHPCVLMCFMALLPPSRVLLLAVVAVCWSQVVIWVKGAAVWELEQSPLIYMSCNACQPWTHL